MIQGIRAKYLREHVDLTRKQLSDLSKNEDVDTSDLVFGEAEHYCNKAIEYIDRGDLDAALYGYVYAQLCVGLIRSRAPKYARAPRSHRRLIEAHTTSIAASGQAGSLSCVLRKRYPQAFPNGKRITAPISRISGQALPETVC